MAFNLTSIARIKSYYLKGVLAIYVIAYASLYVQVQGLFGDNGLAPLRDVASKVTASAKQPLEAYNVILFAPKLGLSYATFVELLCLLGILVTFSALLIRRLANAFTFGLLWFTYYSISTLGQGFMSFHSDLLLLEVGFITILLAPFLPTSKAVQSDHDHLAFFLIKWLVFRYFVTNVINVYLDGDKSWYDMTAIPMVAHGVQFPSLLSWQVYNLPLEYVKLYQAYEHAVKITAPFLLLLDLKYSRLLGFYTLLFVAIPSALFFNFGWTDLLITVCLLSFLKDSYFYSDKRAKQSKLRGALDFVVSLAYINAVVYILIKFYGLKYVKGHFESRVMFTPAQFKLLVDHLVPASLLFGVAGMLFSTYTTYFKSNNKTSIIKTFAYTVVVFGLFLSTFPTLVRFSPGLETKVKPIAMTKDLSRLTAPYMLSNNYILVSKMSQHYGSGRPELNIQVREPNDDQVWKQIDLRYKTGNPASELKRVIPHLPRVDLKMWYAARSSIENNQWLYNLAYRVSTNAESLSGIISPSTPIPKSVQVRVALHTYKYSTKDKTPFAGYWSQSKFVSEYLPASNVDALRSVVKAKGLNLTPASKPSGSVDSFDKLLTTYLEMISEYVRKIDQISIIWSLSAIATISLIR